MRRIGRVTVLLGLFFILIIGYNNCGWTENQFALSSSFLDEQEREGGQPPGGGGGGDPSPSDPSDPHSPVYQPPLDEIPDLFPPLPTPIPRSPSEMLALSNGVSILKSHPRLFFASEHLEKSLKRAYGPQAREPYQSWFNTLKSREDGVLDTANSNVANLAFIYKATQDVTYKNAALNQINTRVSAIHANGSGKGTDFTPLLIGLDLLMDDISDATLLKILEVSGRKDSFFYNSQTNDVGSFGYHGPYTIYKAVAFAALLAGKPILNSPTVTSNPTLYSFKPELILQSALNQMSPNGYFYLIERRIAGDPTYNTALPGSKGGLYDNFAYDRSEEADSIHMVGIFSTLLAQDFYSGFYHDRYRGYFYQNMALPGLRGMPIIWNTLTMASSGPNSDKSLYGAHIYADPYMQWWAKKRAYDIFAPKANGKPFDYDLVNGHLALLYYDDQLDVIEQNTNPLSNYFSGPGLVTTRSSWDDDAVHGVFICGEGISRRYEDINSFLISKNGESVALHAGGRHRTDAIALKNFWYHIRSSSKNTLKVFDPDETYDVSTTTGMRASLYTSNESLPASLNFGGQIFELGFTTTARNFLTSGGKSRARENSPVDGIANLGDIKKFSYFPNRLTYVMGDGTDAYTEKVGYYERSFVHLLPSTFVIFDRYSTAKPGFKKVWSMKSGLDASIQGVSTAPQFGSLSSTSANTFILKGSKTEARVTSLYPSSKKLSARGGETELLYTDRPLSSSTPIGVSHVKALDTPRSIEIYFVGDWNNLNNKSLTITGKSRTGATVSETLKFTGSPVRVYGTGAMTGGSPTSLTDNTKNWETDQWKGAMILYNSGARALITGNNHNTLYGTFPASWNYYRYEIFKPVLSTLNEYAEVQSVTTTDMEAEFVTLSVRHGFDAENVLGQVESFAPTITSEYKGDPSVGRSAIEIESLESGLAQNFLTVIDVRDKGDIFSTPTLVSGTGVRGAKVGNQVVLFSTGRDELTQFSVPWPSGVSKVFVFDLAVNQTYYVLSSGGQLLVSAVENGGVGLKSNGMGVLEIAY